MERKTELGIHPEGFVGEFARIADRRFRFYKKTGKGKNGILNLKRNDIRANMEPACGWTTPSRKTSSLSNAGTVGKNVKRLESSWSRNMSITSNVSRSRREIEI